MEYRVIREHNGSTFWHRTVFAYQNNKKTAIMTISFGVRELNGPEYQTDIISMKNVPQPHEMKNPRQLYRQYIETHSNECLICVFFPRFLKILDL